MDRAKRKISKEFGYILPIFSKLIMLYHFINPLADVSRYYRFSSLLNEVIFKIICLFY